VELTGSVRRRGGQLSATYELFNEHFEIVRADTWELRDAAYALRYQVYCVENPFEDAELHRDGREQDEFDAHAVHSLVRYRDTGAFAGCVRLILPDPANPAGPLPIEVDCGHAFYDRHQAVRPTIDRSRLAEISRFAVSKAFKRRFAEAKSPSGAAPEVVYQDPGQDPEIAHRVLPHITIGLIAAVIRMSVEHDITYWYAVMEPGLLRLLSRFGIRFQSVGHLVDHHGRRRPAATSVAEVIQRIHRERPDIWEIVSDRGRFPGLEEDSPWLAVPDDRSGDSPCQTP